MPYSNTASVAQLASNITSSAVSATLSSFTGWPGEYPFYGIFNRGAGSAELVLVTAAVGNTVTLTRGQGGTLPSSHNAGETFEHIAPADVFNSFETHMAATSSVHGVTGALAGTSGAQTFQDKEYRGHYTHAYGDALPAGSAAAFEVTASTAIARDGFKVTNTGADSARRAFLLEQSGTPRHEVFQDGTVKTTPSTAATRPAVEANVTATKPGVRVTNASAANATAFNVSGAGDTTVGGTLGVAGASTLAGLSASSLSVSGNTTLTGPVAALTVTGATTLNTLTATGSGTLSGNVDLGQAGVVTLPLPTGGTATRLTVNARTGQNALEIKNQSGNTRFTVTEAGSWQAQGNLIRTKLEADGSTYGVEAGVTTIDGAVVRDTRHSLVHRVRQVAAGLNMGTTSATLGAFPFTPKTACHAKVCVSVVFSSDEGLAGGNYEPGSVVCGYRIVRVSDSVTVFTSDEIYYGNPAGHDSYNLATRSTVAINDVATPLLTAGVGYRLELYGKRFSVLVTQYQSAIGFVEECSRVL